MKISDAELKLEILKMLLYGELTTTKNISNNTRYSKSGVSYRLNQLNDKGEIEKHVVRGIAIWIPKGL